MNTEQKTQLVDEGYRLAKLFRGRARCNQQRPDATTRNEVYNECAAELETFLDKLNSDTESDQLADALTTVADTMLTNTSQLDDESADILYQNRSNLYETDEHNPWTEWSEYCKEIGFEPNISDSNDPVVRLLEPLYDQIKQLADQETEQAQTAKQTGGTFSLDWSQVWINLHTRMTREQQERQSNHDDQFCFETHCKPHTYVWIGGLAYEFDSLIQTLEELQSEGLMLRNPIRVQPMYHRLLTEQGLAEADVDGWWLANVATLDMFIERLYNTHEQWQDDIKE